MELIYVGGSLLSPSPSPSQLGYSICRLGVLPPRQAKKVCESMQDGMKCLLC